MEQIHCIDDQRDIGCILPGGVGELLLRYDCVFRQGVGPAFGAGIGEVAIDTTNACLSDLRNFFEQSINDLRGSIVRINQNSKTWRTQFRRHDALSAIAGNLSRNSGEWLMYWAKMNPHWTDTMSQP